jgi:hypothetical protein
VASADTHTFLRYKLTATTLSLGERLRAGLFRPCARVFRYSALAGAFKDRFGTPAPIHAVARFVGSQLGRNRVETLSFAPRDRSQRLSVVPLEIEYLANVSAEVFVLRTVETAAWPKSFHMSMGAMRSKGFGRCQLRFAEEVTCGRPEVGNLCVRVPDTKDVLAVFGIRNVLAPVYGYLFQPTSSTSGVYIRSLFEGSRVASYPIILESEGEGQ